MQGKVTKMNRVVTAMMLLFPAAILTIKGIDPIIFYILTSLGIYIAISERVTGFSVPELRLYSWITFGFFSIMSISVLCSSEPTNSPIHLSRIAHFLVAPFLILTLYKVRVPFEKLLVSIKLGAVSAGVVAIGGYILEHGHGRFSGMYNANTFGDLSVILSIFTITSVKTESKKMFLLSLLSLSLGITAVVLSGSRGAMLSFLLTLFVYLIVQHRMSSGKYIRAVISFVTALSVFSIIAFGAYDTQGRIDKARSEISSWESGKNKTTSVGLRLEMYRAGTKAFLDSLWIGYGYYNATTVAARYASPKKTAEVIAGFWHLHNEFLSTLVSAGILGLLSLLFLYFLPLHLFWKKLLDAKHEGYASIIIAHRLSTIQQCNKVIVLEQGRVVALGGYEEVSRSEAFRRNFMMGSSV